MEIMIQPQENILPPSPPTCKEELQVEKENFIPGEFLYVKSSSTRKMLQTAWQAITLTENWDFVKQDIESFTFSDDKRTSDIYYKIEQLGYSGHSGISFGHTMREMQSLAKYGEEEYSKKFK
jgi:hypothetical protein